ncbi:MAG: polysaccharide deacetylase family protein [Cyclobacteriaceae bacterium]|nr:polysaccharide deacetylase family protein [Cyclobacteriaceae bacterium]
MKLDRRKFIQQAGLTAGAVLAGNYVYPAENPGITHILSLSFDDGFARSFIKTADIYEKYGLKACFNVIASGGTPGFKGVDDYILPGTMGDFDLWNELQDRGHEVMPHSYKHANLTQIPMEEVKDLFTRCMDVFADQLKGFKPENSIYNFPFNASNPEVESWIGKRVMAFRTAGDLVNPMPDRKRKKLTCISQGPDNIDDYLSAQVDKFLGSAGGWFIFNTHGLDGEGWGPLSSGLLDEMLAEFVEMKHVAVLPVGTAYRQFG